ncbi:MAG TPA: YfhO family protein [Candidatus Kapabacteria bacterium]|nr:YfhO family protein [Candidatus Kapabacteria bacterium]
MAKSVAASAKAKPASALPKLAVPIVLGILAVLVIIFYYPLLFGGKFLWEDFVEQEFPFRTLAATSLAQGHIPGWNPYVFCGMPFTADIQIAFWYPMNMLQSLFVSNGALSPTVMQWFIVLHYLVAAAGMYFCVRELFKTDEWSALLAACAYAFGGYLTAQPMHQMIVYQLAIFPWVVMLFIKGSDSWKHSIAAGLALGVMYLAGHPQTSLYLTFFLGLLGVYEIVYRLRHKEGFSGAMVARLLVPAIIAFGIFTIQLLPAQELAGLSKRDVMTFEKSVEGSLTFGHLYTLVLPRLFGVSDAMQQAKVPYWNGPYFLSWETMCYIGIIPLVFAIAAAFGNWKRKYVSFFAAMSLVAVLFSLGDHFFIYKIFFSLPLFDKLRTPARMMMVFTFSMTALSGAGLASLLRGEISANMKKGMYIALGLVTFVWLAALVGIFSPQSFGAKSPESAIASISWAAGLAAFPVIAAILIGILAVNRKLTGVILAGAAIAVTVIELYTYGAGLNSTVDDPRAAYADQPQVIDLVKNDQAKEISRARIRSDRTMLMKRNQGAYDRIQLLEGYNPLVLARNAPQCVTPDITADLLNIKWSILSVSQKVDFGQRPQYLPRTKMYYKTVVKPDAEAMNFLKTDASFDYWNTILLEEQPSIAIANADVAPKDSITRYETDEIEAHVKTSENGMAFFSEIYYPAWHAYIDGKETKLYRAFTDLRAVEVPKGEHTIVLKYESDAFKTGSMITLITLAGSIVGLVLVSRKKKESVPA